MIQKELFTKINNERLINSFLNLVKIESPSLEEQKIINYLIKILKSLNLSVKLQKVGKTGNIIAFLKGKNSKNSIFFNAHFDTVKPCQGIKPVIKNGIIKTDGKTILGADDKAAIAIFIELVNILKKTDINRPDIYFVLTYGEEIGLQGAKHFDFNLLKAKYGFSFDANGEVGTIIMSAPTHYTYNIKVYGKSAHAGIEPEKGKNAIKIASEIINKIKTGRIDFETTANIGRIEGGKATNIVPDLVEFTGEIRSRTETKIKKYIEQLEKVLDTIKKKYETKIDFDLKLAYKSFKFDKNSFLVKIVKEACDLINVEPKYVESNGGSDANIFNQNGYPTINLGIGMQNVHTTEEFIKIRDIVNGVKLALALVQISASK